LFARAVDGGEEEADEDDADDDREQDVEDRGQVEREPDPACADRGEDHLPLATDVEER